MIKTVIIGLGVIGDVHAEILKKQNRNVVALCDTEEGKIRSFQEKFFPDAQGFTNWKEMIDAVKPDVVHICTPHFLHTEMILYCLQKDMHVLCEKPLCMKEEDIPLILQAEKSSKGQLGVCFQHRYNPVNIFVKEYLAGKEILGGYGNLVWHKEEAYYRADEWRGTKAQEGGGVLINQAIHTLDILEWLIGEPDIATARVDTLTLTDCIEVEDSAMCVFTGKSNFILFATNSAIVNFPISATIVTKTDTIAFTLDSVTVNNKTIDYKKESRILGKSYYGTWHENLIDDYYDCIISGRKFAIDGCEGSKAVKLVLAAYKSGGLPVRIEK